MAGLNKYRAYPEYNFTNIEGLVQLPSHWELKQVRYLLKNGAEGTKIGPFGSSLKLEDMVDDGVQVYGQENVIKRDFSLGKRRISFNKFKEMGAYEVFFGDILITMMGTSGKCEIVPQTAEKGIIDSHLIRVRVNNKLIIPDFFKLLVDESPEIKHQIKIQGKGSIMLGLNSGVIRSLYLPLPGISEQKLILGFLDYETKKIDNLIEKQQQLIEFLKEKRQAMISHAVTKGLNPDVPMKDSGVEWLGEVPEHWSVIPLKHVCALIKDGTHLPPPRVDNGIPLLSVRNIVDGVFQFRDDDSHISHKDYKLLCSSFVPKKDDVLLAIVGATLGKVALVPEMGSFHIQRSLGVFRTNELILPQHLSYIFESKDFQNLLWENAGFSAQPGIYLGTLSNFCVPLPPVTEQLKISEFITATVDKLDLLISQASRLIALIQERRTALISAAVTGKIDVRDWVAPDTQDIEASQEATA
ncbi:MULTISPECIES: restriction endonuclease subunit S [Klebsiella]|uniref:restriction endonuclease subunit S n=1 Tax=Klebsiella TaxID=570 RepID=UPI0007CC74F7|nr:MULTISPECIES: restriction endonuclease subunit S [Klebsiella]HCI5980364.1 restriction endonuclease subunit S [Klebsiella variicola subsp. variicola]MCP9031655.1 restriction endonuclease subunit S [Klebsiella sp. SWET4]MDK6226805.1 restriction endonuclease subunit S [Klebsiella variicola]MDP1293068.1 restriction endonuclease subunit S [Klebsiella variicola]MDP1340024.1 restriction endonuclease subunit S [Klebsiella variicola]